MAQERILAVTAHPDDADYFFAGTIAAWTDAGAHVVYAVATDGATVYLERFRVLHL